MEYITGKYYGVYNNGKLLYTSVGIYEAIAQDIHNWFLWNDKKQVLTIDYIREDQAKQLDRDIVHLFEMTGQVDESFLKYEHLPMTVTYDMVKDAMKYEYHKRSLN